MLGKLFRSFTGKSGDDTPRSPTGVGDLQPGDILTFKQRRTLPDEMQGGSYEVASIGSYQYEDGLHTQLTLVSQDRSKLYLSFDSKDSEAELCWSKPVGRTAVLELFAEDQFSELWEDGFSNLQTTALPEQFAGWLVGSYEQTKNEATCYFFDEDMRGKRLSNVMDDNSEELRYHECTGEDDRFALTIEISANGETDITLDVYSPSDVIDTIFPANST